MENLFKTGRIFYGVAIAEIGIQTIYYHNFPYIVPLPKNLWIPGLITLAIIVGAIFILAGTCIVFEKKTRQVSLLFGAILLLAFCFYYIPYEFLISTNYMHFGDWENAAKELSLAGGAFVIAYCFPRKNEGSLTRFLGKLIPFGAALFPITIISFSIDHFLYAKEAQGYVPSWIPYHLFWMYFAGVALLGSGIAIILKIRTGLIAALLGVMIFLWFISLHMPRVMASSPADIADEITSAILALAYSGTAFVLAGTATKA
ncbi:hypothetical protein ACPPVU_22305 [Mucilaginibacter sp. McL0603]|uniref:hypothetical protein n=1 Tax=Mucilaginibacter sp. McL0603 TaxID=3415670 RepID=UPI003CEA18C3